MKSSEILLRGREILLEHGHTKFALADAHGVCARGALLLAVGANWQSTPAWKDYLQLGQPENYLYRYLQLEHRWDIVDWNNAPERTQQDVLDAFYEAALLAKEDNN